MNGWMNGSKGKALIAGMLGNGAARQTANVLSVSEN